MRARHYILAFSVVALAACASPGGGGPAPDPSTKLDTSNQGNSPPIDHTPLDPSKRPVTSAVAQRLSVAQLRNTFPVVLGKDAKGNDITWMIGNKPGFDSMASVLGEPDYDQVTNEDLTPSPLYLKFMDDAARDACGRMMTADFAVPDKAKRSFVRMADLADVDPEATKNIDDNIRYLKLRFHGVKLDPANATAVAPIRTLFSGGVAASTSQKAEDKAKSGWMVVCVAMLTAPEFHLY